MSAFQEKAVLMILNLKSKGEPYEFVEMNCNGTKTFKELFALLWDLEDTHRELTPKLVPAKKNRRESELYRHIAQENFGAGNYFNALKLINMSILSAPHPVIRSSEDVLSSADNGDIFSPPIISADRFGGASDADSLALSLAYAERSTMLFCLKAYDKCLRDVDLSLQCGQNYLLENERKALEERKEMCLLAQNSAPCDTKTGPRTPLKKKFAEFAETTPLRRDLQEIDDVLNVRAKLSFDELDPESLLSMINGKVMDPPEIKEVNPAFPALSNALTVSYEPSKGRHVKATRNIRTGDILGVERAYVACINTENLLLYCSSCFRFCFLPIPCPTCNKIIFCSESCRLEGLQEEHWIECVILHTMNHYAVGYRNIVYKILKTITYGRLREILKELEKEKIGSPETFGFDKNGIYSSTSYETVHYLCTNKERLTFEYLFQPCQFAFFITKLLHLSGRFFIDDNGQPKEPTREDILTTGAVVLAHILRVRNNCLGFGELKVDNVYFSTRKLVGMGIFPTLSLINHSCNASTKVYNHGRFLVLRAIRPIAAGDEITVSYLPDSLEEEIESRRKSLRGYCFECHCEACENSWPRLLNMPFEPVDKDPKPRRRTREIENKVRNIAEITCAMVAKFKSGSSPVQSDYDSIRDAIETLYRYSWWPCRVLYNTEKLLVTCFEAGL